MIPELAPLECERTGLRQRNPIELGAGLGLRDPIRGFTRSGLERERGLELALGARVVLGAEQAETRRQQSLVLGPCAAPRFTVSMPALAAGQSGSIAVASRYDASAA